MEEIGKARVYSTSYHPIRLTYPCWRLGLLIDFLGRTFVVVDGGSWIRELTKAQYVRLARPSSPLGQGVNV